jgi:hypothetical protein
MPGHAPCAAPGSGAANYHRRAAQPCRERHALGQCVAAGRSTAGTDLRQRPERFDYNLVLRAAARLCTGKHRPALVLLSLTVLLADAVLRPQSVMMRRQIAGGQTASMSQG